MSLPIRNLIFLCCHSHFTIININYYLRSFMNDLSRIKGTSMSSSISMTTKSIRKANSPTFTITSSTTRWGYLIDLSTSCNVILIGRASRFPILSIIHKDIKLMLAPKSRALLTGKSPIVTRIVKLSGSFNFEGKDFLIITLQPASNSVVSS